MRSLIIDNDTAHAAMLGSLVREKGLSVEHLDKIPDPLPDINEFDVVFLSLDCAGKDGISILEQTEPDDTTEVILMNEVDDPPRVSRGIALGATYFAKKPCDTAFVESLLEDVFQESASREKAPEMADDDLDQFVLLRGGSSRMRRLYRTMRKVARQETTVLIIGESGVGKDLVAQSLHLLSPRAEQDLHAFNCASIPAELFESELFGHEKGSFSGAINEHQGFFERADGGTLFLDEVTEMPMELQAKLLRVLETGMFRRVGGERDIRCDVRIIASTNRLPEQAVAEKHLREDLYFRLAAFPLKVPALRDRGDDRQGLARYFLQELNTHNSAGKFFTDEVLALIDNYSWPGNVRQLKSVIERAFVLASEEIGLKEFGQLSDEQKFSGPADEDEIKVSVGSTVAEAEKALIYAALDKHEGKKKLAAESLGISLKTLYNKLAEYEQSAAGDKSG